MLALGERTGTSGNSALVPKFRGVAKASREVWIAAAARRGHCDGWVWLWFRDGTEAAEKPSCGSRVLGKPGELHPWR